MPPDNHRVETGCPAKINLTLAILGKRPDAFHDLHSIVAQTHFGDRLTLEWQPGQTGPDEVTVQGADLPAGDNSVATALRVFREQCGFRRGRFTAVLEKRIPVGAGLGGGSSDAVAALRAVRQVLGAECPDADWPDLAARIGSDCPLFLRDGPVLMEGRGERITPLPEMLAARLRGRTVYLFKPGFPIHTAEAYRRLAAGRFYSSREAAVGAFADWCSGTAPVPAAGNDFQRLAEHWMPSLAVVLKRLNERGIDARLSGSGSACFAFDNGTECVMEDIRKELYTAWGEHCWLVGTALK